MSEPVSAKLPEGLLERLEAERDDGESRSAAVNRLLRAGLNSSSTDDRLERIASTQTLWYVGALFAASLAGIVPVPYLGSTAAIALTLAVSVVAFAVAVFTLSAVVLAQIALDRPMLALVGLSRRGE